MFEDIGCFMSQADESLEKKIILTPEGDLKPTTEQIRTFLISTIQHVCHVEYFIHHISENYEDFKELGTYDLDRLGLTEYNEKERKMVLEMDDLRPHDIEGNGNKLMWAVIQGLALQNYNIHENGDNQDFFKKFVLPSIELHRQQHHHKIFNGPDFAEKFSYLPKDAVKGGFRLGALDALCSLLQNREYQGGKHTYDDLPAIIKSNPPHKQYTMNRMMNLMKELPQPDIEQINNLEDIPNIGLPPQMYAGIKERYFKAIQMLNDEQGYTDLIKTK
jgi:hypothetical protein